jgi:hypothetical protein
LAVRLVCHSVQQQRVDALEYVFRAYTEARDRADNSKMALLNRILVTCIKSFTFRCPPPVTLLPSHPTSLPQGRESGCQAPGAG